MQASATSDYQLFYLNATTALVDNLYLANSDLALCGNAFFQSAKNYTKGLSLTLQNSKFYNDTHHSKAYTWFATYYGSDTHDYYRYSDREFVKTVIRNNLFYNCSKNSESNPAANALFNLRFSQPSFSYEITGNTFVEDREAYHFLTDDKHLGTDVFSQFLHLYPMNNGIGGPTTDIDLSKAVKVTGNRFIGRNTVINAELTYANSTPDLEDNFYIGYDTVQAMSDIDEIYTAAGEDPYKAVNMEFGDVDNYYLDYDMSVSAEALKPQNASAVKGHTVTLTQSSGVLTPADLAEAGQSVSIYSDADRTQSVASIDVSALGKGSHVYYLTVTKDGVSDEYILVIHTAQTERTYEGAVMYDPAVAELPAGTLYFKTMNSVLYAFAVGESVFADIDDIVVHTQTSVPTVLLPAGNYTAEELSVVESVNYIYDESALYAVPSVKKEKIKVLCVGDSITLGTGAGNRTLYAYPARLQELLGEDYEVLNYGRGGALGTDSSGYGYESTWNYSLSLKEAPDLIIMAFGANDAQSGYYKVPLDYFKQETLEMIRRYQALPSKPIVYMTTTTNIISDWNQSWLTELRAIQKDTAQTAGIGLIDGYSLSLNWGDSSAIYSDNCHFNAAGYEKMAADYKAAIDWSAKGAHQPEVDQVSITFTAFACEHEAGELTVECEPTCGKTGLGHKDCLICGRVAEADVVIPATGKHSWDKGVVTKEPTTAKEGVKTYTCSVCSATKTEKIAKLAPKVSFTDVKKSDYFYSAVAWAVEAGVTTGTTKTTFGPEESCTRAQAVTFLWRAAGSPAPKTSNNPFKDVKKSDYYYKAVLWAVENGITKGTSATAFSPDEACTRGQIVTFLWRAESGKKVSASNPFKDVKAGDYYYNAVLWAVKMGVTTGTEADKFSPADTCTRGQIVTFLYRAMK